MTSKFSTLCGETTRLRLVLPLEFSTFRHHFFRRNLLSIWKSIHPWTARAVPRPLVPLVTLPVLTFIDNFWHLSYYVRMITIQSNRSDKKAKKKETHSWPENSNENLVPLATHFHLIPFHAKILTVFSKTFPTEVKPGKCPTKKKTTGKTG